MGESEDVLQDNLNARYLNFVDYRYAQVFGYFWYK